MKRRLARMGGVPLCLLNPQLYKEFLDLPHRAHRIESQRVAIYGTTQRNNRAHLSYLYDRHHEHVEQYFKNRADDLLIMNIFDGDGWDVLCPFLGTFVMYFTKRDLHPIRPPPLPPPSSLIHYISMYGIHVDRDSFWAVHGSQCRPCLERLESTRFDYRGSVWVGKRSTRGLYFIDPPLSIKSMEADEACLVGHSLHRPRAL